MVLAGHVTSALLPAWFTSNKLLWVAWKNVKMSWLSVSIHSLTDRNLTGSCCTTRHYFHTTVIVLFYINVSSLSVSLLSRRLCSSYSTSLSFFLTALSSSSWTHSLHSYPGYKSFESASFCTHTLKVNAERTFTPRGMMSPQLYLYTVWIMLNMRQKIKTKIIQVGLLPEAAALVYSLQGEQRSIF